MTSAEYIAATGRTFRRARIFERQLCLLAAAVDCEGFPSQALGLRNIAARAVLAAERYVDFLAVRVEDL